MRKKKKGATLIVVIIVFMFVFSVSMAMLSMVGSNYRARVSESKRVENLYSSESGIDMAYNITGKTIGSGIKYGYFQVSELRRKQNKGPNAPRYAELVDEIEELEKKIIDLKKHNENKTAGDVRNYNNEIKQCKETIQTDTLAINELFKNEFKRAFKFYIQNNEKVDHTNVLVDSIIGKKYTDVSLTYNNPTSQSTTTVDAKDVEVEYSDYDVEFPNEKTITDANGNKKTFPFLTATLELIKPTNTTGEYYNLTIESEFISTEENAKVLGENKRTVRASYKITVPDYEDALSESSTGEMKNYNIRGLTIGGDMSVNDVNSLDVKGDIFVQGDKNGEASGGITFNKVYDKYNGGIKINKSTKVNFLPESSGVPVNVSTRGTFNIQNDSNVVIGSKADDTTSIFKDSNSLGNLYAANIYAGNSKEFVNNSRLDVSNNVVVDNDLAVKATRTNLYIKNFYGINDKNINYDDGSKQKPSNYKDNNKIDSFKNVEKRSSSIMINGHTDADGNGKSYINIVGSAYIMGTAHIDTADKYQTGESIAVKGNYIAYAVPVSSDEVFKYDNPLQVLDEDNIFKKAKHFTDYWNGTGEWKDEDKDGVGDKDKNGIKLSPSNADDGGIILPKDAENIHSIGAIVYKVNKSSDNKVNTSVRSSNYQMEDEKEGGAVYLKRAEYAKQVYNLGLTTHAETPEYYIDKYNDDNVDNIAELFKGLEGLASLSDKYNFEAELNKLNTAEKGVALFNLGNENGEKFVADDIVIDGTAYTENNPKKVKAIIVTNGNVIIKGNVDFQGTIIAKGNLEVKRDEYGVNVANGAHVQITHNTTAVDEIERMPEYSEAFEAVFANFEAIAKDDANSSDKTLLKQVLDAQYDIKRYLVNKLWQLIR